MLGLLEIGGVVCLFDAWFCVCRREGGRYIYVKARAEDRRIRMSCLCRSELIEWDRSMNVMS